MKRALSDQVRMARFRAISFTQSAMATGRRRGSDACAALFIQEGRRDRRHFLSRHSCPGRPLRRRLEMSATGPSSAAAPEWAATGPAEPRMTIGPLRIDAIPAQWDHGSFQTNGKRLQVVDTISGDILADFRHALDNRLIDGGFVPEGRIHIGFGIEDHEHVLIIDPAARSCRLAGGEWRALSAMQPLVDGALQAMRERQSRRHVHSPDGRVRMEYLDYERRNNEWLQRPEIRDLESGGLVLEDTGTIEDAGAVWLAPGRFYLHCVNLYAPALTVYFDLDAGTVRLQEDGSEEPIAQAPSLIKDWFDRHTRIEQGPPQPTGMSLNQRLKQIGIIAVIVALFYLGLFYFGGFI